MEICSIDISAVMDRLNLLCCVAGLESMGGYVGGISDDAAEKQRHVAICPLEI